MSSQHKVRSSQQDRTLESMFPVVHPAARGVSDDDGSDEVAIVEDDIVEVEEPRSSSKVKDIPESQCYLTSVSDLRQETLAGKHNRMLIAFDIY